MSNYLVEFRFIDSRAKIFMKGLSGKIYDKFNIGPKHFVPHITLVGGFTTSNEEQLVRDVGFLCSSSPIMHFEIKGFSTFDQTRVFYLDINPDENLKRIRWKMAQKLKRYCYLNKPYDLQSEDEFVFHATVARNIPPQIFNPLKKFIFSMNVPLKTNYVLVRVTILKNKLILKEYDFLQRKLLTQNEARSPYYYHQTNELLKIYLENH